MVRSVGRARAAALIGMMPEASRIPPASAARSLRPQGASARYSLRVVSGSGGVPELILGRSLREDRVGLQPWLGPSEPVARGLRGRRAWSRWGMPPIQLA